MRHNGNLPWGVRFAIWRMYWFPHRTSRLLYTDSEELEFGPMKWSKPVVLSKRSAESFTNDDPK